MDYSREFWAGLATTCLLSVVALAGPFKIVGWIAAFGAVMTVRQWWLDRRAVF